MQVVSNAVLKEIPKNYRSFVVLDRGRATVDDETKNQNPSRSAIWVGISLATLQVLDGLLTHMGIMRFGINSECNVLLRGLMEVFEPLLVLGVLKSTAILIVAFLTYMSPRYHWVKGAMASVSALYFFVAILPWFFVLYLRNPV